MKIWISLLCLIGSFPLLHGQSYFGKDVFTSLDIAGNGTQYSAALGINKRHYTGEARHFYVGYGIRNTFTFSNTQDFITAPAILTTGQKGLAAMTAEIQSQNLDTLVLSGSAVNMLNLSIHLGWRFNDKWAVEFNIDAIGLSFGPEQSGVYTSDSMPEFNGAVNANPTSPNYLLIGDNDIGSLSSGLKVSYLFSANWGVYVRAGYLFTEYTTENKLALGNDRFRNKAMTGGLGITYAINR